MHPKKNLYPWVTLFQTTPSCFGTCLLRSQVSHPGVWAPVLRDAPPSAESPHRRPPPGGQWRWPPDHCRVPWHEARWRHSSMLGWLMQQKEWQGDGKWWWWIYMFEKHRIHTNPLNMIAGFNQNVLEHFMIFKLPHSLLTQPKHLEVIWVWGASFYIITHICCTERLQGNRTFSCLHIHWHTKMNAGPFSCICPRIQERQGSLKG